jgi:hypothetical protein
MRVNVNAVAFGIIQTRFGLPQSEREVIQTGERTIRVGMPAKQAQRMGVTDDPDRAATEERSTRPKPCPCSRSGARERFKKVPPSSGCARRSRITSPDR